MNLGLKWMVFLGVLTVQVSGQADEKSFQHPRLDQTKGNLAWKKKMMDLYRVLSDVLVDVSSDENFRSSKNSSRIEKNAKKLSDLASDLTSDHVISPDPDPGVRMLSSLFSKEAKHAYLELKRGHQSYARNILRSVSGYCFACHSRNQSGPSFSSLPMDKSLASLSAFDKGQFFAATRQFDRALDQFEAIIADPTATQTQLLKWEGAVRYGLAISVRVKQDPTRALNLVGRVLATPKAPSFLRENATQWRDSLVKWQAEPSREMKTEEGLYSEVLRLISMAQNTQSYPADRKADIHYLRATAAIHDLMRIAPNGIHTAEAFLLAGVSYQALRDLSIWELHEFYYEACVRQSPHTPIAQTCFHRFEETTYAGYSGTGGMSLPLDVKMKLTELEELAKPLVIAPRN